MLKNRLSNQNGAISPDNEQTGDAASTRTNVANSITVMMEMFAGLAFILVIALSMTMFGCGTDETPANVKSVAVNTPAPDVTSQPIVEPVVEPIAEVIEPEVVTYEKAESVFNDRNYNEAQRLFALYAEEHDGNAWGHYMLGLSAKRAGDLETAESAFRRATELDPNHVKSLLNLSRVLIDDLRAEEALQELDRALDIDPESNVAYRLQGRAFHNLGWMDDAVNAYRTAIVIDSADAWSMNNLALVKLEQERYEEALSVLARTIELRDDVAIFFNNLGMALEHTGHVRDAQNAYASAVELDDAYTKASTNLARVEGIEQDADVLSVDFEALAQIFIEQIRTWNEEALAFENAFIEEIDEAMEEVTVDSSLLVIDN